MSKKFKDTKAGKLLSGLKNPILDLVGDVVPGASMITNIIKQITGDNTIDPRVKTSLLEELKSDLDRITLENEDRSSARSREIEISKSGKSDWMMMFVGISVLFGYGAIVYVALFGSIPNNEIYYFIAGNVFSFGAAIVTYYFGSSKGSKDKDKLINSQ